MNTKFGKVLLNVSSAAVVIDALRVKCQNLMCWFIFYLHAGLTLEAPPTICSRRLSVFTVSFTRILQELMQKMKSFSTVLLTSQVVLVQSLQPKGPEFESTQDLVFLVFLPLYSIRLTSLL